MQSANNTEENKPTHPPFTKKKKNKIKKKQRRVGGNISMSLSVASVVQPKQARVPFLIHSKRAGHISM